MRVLVIGGSGYVGAMVIPAFAEHHELRIFDPRPPEVDGRWEYVEGTVTDYEALVKASRGMEALVYMATGPLCDWTASPVIINQHFDVNVKGLHLALLAAHEAGISQAVVTSSMSVYYQEHGTDAAPTEDAPPDAHDIYGLTKRLGEEVCRAAVARDGLRVVALRLCLPVPDDAWPPAGSLRTRTIATSGRDTARSILCGLEFALDDKGVGFEAFTISGDALGQIMKTDKARQLLGWEPLDSTARKVTTSQRSSRRNA